jgi:hypothetical protein
MGFVVGKVALAQVVLPVLQFPAMLNSHLNLITLSDGEVWE